MGWTSPKTWITAAKLYASELNTHVRDQLRYLKGLDGAIVLQDQLTVQGPLIIDNAGADEYLKIPSLTTTQRNAIGSPAAGMLIYNSTTGKFNKYENGGWRDDLAYNGDISLLQIASQASGDIIIRGASAWERLAKGSANSYMRMDAGGNYPAWATGIFKSKLVNGSRTAAEGSGSEVVTGAGFAPIAAIIMASYSEGAYACHSNGHVDSSGGEYCTYDSENAGASVKGVAATAIQVDVATTYGYAAVVATLDSDGLTFTFTHYGGSGSCQYAILFLG